MAMSGLFWGNAATEGNKSLMEWQRLWMAEDEAKRQDARENERIMLEGKRVEWEQERYGLERERLEGDAARTRQQALWDDQYKTWQSVTDPDQKEAMLHEMGAQGNDRYAFAVSEFNRSLITDPSVAFGLLDSVLNAEPGRRFLIPMVKEAATTAGRMTGLSGKDLEEFVNEYVAYAEQQNSEAPEFDELAKEQLRLGVAQARANHAETETRTSNIAANTQHQLAVTDEFIKQGFRNEELHQFITQEYAQNLELGAQQLIASIFNNEEMQPAVLAQLLAKTEETEFANEFNQATRDVLIQRVRDEARRVSADADIAEVQASFAFDNAQLDIALKANDLAQGEKAIEAVDQQIRESMARVEELGANTEAIRATTNNNAVKMVMDIVASGNVALLGDNTRSLLANVVGEEEADNALAQLKEVAQRNLDEDDARAQANIIIADAEATFAYRRAEAAVRQAEADAWGQEWRNSISEEQRLFDNDMKAQGIQISWEDVNLRRQSLLHQIEQSKNAGTVPTNQSSVLTNAYKIAGVSGENVQDAIDAYNAAVAKGRGPGGLLAQAMDGDRDALMELRLEYGTTDLDSLEEILRAAEESARQGAVNRIAMVFAAGMDSTGVPLRPEAFGLSPNDPIYMEAMLRYPGMQLEQSSGTTSVGAEVESAIINDIKKRALFLSPENVQLAGPEEVYRQLIATHGEEAVEAMGLSPATIQPIIQQAQAQYAERFNPTRAYLEGAGFDIYSPTQRQNAQTFLTQSSTALTNLMNEINTTDWSNNNAQAWSIYQRLVSVMEGLPGKPRPIPLANAPVVYGITTVSLDLALPQIVQQIQAIEQNLANLQILEPQIDSAFIGALRNRK